MKKILKEFKDFIARGNVLDMAIGVIIAGAFGKITTSLVNDILMPFISWIFGTRDMTALNVVVREAGSRRLLRLHGKNLRHRDPDPLHERL